MRGLVRASRLCFVGVGEPTLGVGVQQMQYEEDAHCLLFVVPFPPASHHLSSPQTNPPRLVYTDPNDLQKCAQSYVTATVWKPIAGVAGGGSWIGGEGKTSCSPCPNHSVTVAEGSADVSGAALLRVVCAGRGDCLCSCVLGCVAFLGLLRQHVPSCSMHAYSIYPCARFILTYTIVSPALTPCVYLSMPVQQRLSGRPTPPNQFIHVGVGVQGLPCGLCELAPGGGSALRLHDLRGRIVR